MKILIYTSKFPPQIGGVENVTYNLARQFNKKKKHDVLVLTSLDLNQKVTNIYGKFTKGFIVSGLLKEHQSVKVKEVFMSVPRSFLGLLSLPYRLLASIIKIRSVIQEYNPHVINFHFPDDSLYYFYFSTLGLNIPIITNIHGNELHLFSKNPIYKFFLSKILDKSRGIVVNSQFMKEELLKTYSFTLRSRMSSEVISNRSELDEKSRRSNPRLKNSKLYVISNGISLEKFRRESKNFKYKKNSYYLFIGRFDKKKGLDVLVKAYNRVSNKLKRKLVIVGGPSGESRHGSIQIEKMKNLAKTDKIIFTGRVSPQEVTSFYKNAYFSIFPSLYEPFGIVALESMACGTPIIASSGGFKEIIKENETGIIFDPGNINELESILLKADKDEEMREKLSKRAEKDAKNYSWNSIAQRYLDLFTRI